MNAAAERRKIIWRFSDGRAGHDAQSKGLVSALAGRIDCDCYDIHVPLPFRAYLRGLLKKFPFSTHLAAPDLLVGAGHATHLPMLLARHVRGGLAIVLMKPSLPTGLFDLCLIPDHDSPGTADNILATVGPLNLLRPSPRLSAAHGLILVGGKSRHFNWNEALLQQQLLHILNQQDLHWTVADSPRTPCSTATLLKKLIRDRGNYLSFRDTGTAGIVDVLQTAGKVWVSEDSMSMIYEALTTGAAVGILQVPQKKNDRLARVARSLANRQLLTLYNDWVSGQALSPPASPLCEAARCVETLVERFGWAPVRPL